MSRIRPLSPPSLSGNSSVVEHRLAKARVEGSNPFSRSNFQALEMNPLSTGVLPLHGVWARGLILGVNVATRNGVPTEAETGGLFACAREPFQYGEVFDSLHEFIAR